MGCQATGGDVEKSSSFLSEDEDEQEGQVPVPQEGLPPRSSGPSITPPEPLSIAEGAPQTEAEQYRRIIKGVSLGEHLVARVRIESSAKVERSFPQFLFAGSIARTGEVHRASIVEVLCGTRPSSSQIKLSYVATTSASPSNIQNGEEYLMLLRESGNEYYLGSYMSVLSVSEDGYITSGNHNFTALEIRGMCQ